jgi:hypothetical protein
MSDEIIYVIPNNENYKPESDELEIIERFVNDHKSMFSCELRISETVQFYDCGENFEKIQCPFCRAELSIEWWQEEMSRASESNFEDLDIVTPCCRRNSSLNKLRYSFPQGFAKFAIEIMNNDKEGSDIQSEFVATLSNVTGVDWNTIFAHY